MTPPTPTLRHERVLLRSGVQVLACIDEVGRGALAGPVSVGVTVLSLSVGSAPRGLRDSKLLTPSARLSLLPQLRRWPVAHAVGHTEPAEIDAVGIIAALRVAAARAFAALPVRPELALLDGNHDWVTDREPNVLFADSRTSTARDLADLSVLPARVVVRIKADQTCAGVAAASVLAKCERDALMVELAGQHPQYRWEMNKGYSAPEHIEALAVHGPSVLHRCSWNLPGCGSGTGRTEQVMVAAVAGDGDAVVAGDAAVAVAGADGAVDLFEPSAGALSTVWV